MTSVDMQQHGLAAAGFPEPRGPVSRCGCHTLRRTFAHLPRVRADAAGTPGPLAAWATLPRPVPARVATSSRSYPNAVLLAGGRQRKDMQLDLHRPQGSDGIADAR